MELDATSLSPSTSQSVNRRSISSRATAFPTTPTESTDAEVGTVGKGHVLTKGPMDIENRRRRGEAPSVPVGCADERGG